MSLHSYPQGARGRAEDTGDKPRNTKTQCSTTQAASASPNVSSIHRGFKSSKKCFNFLGDFFLLLNKFLRPLNHDISHKNAKDTKTVMQI